MDEVGMKHRGMLRPGGSSRAPLFVILGAAVVTMFLMANLYSSNSQKYTLEQELMSFRRKYDDALGSRQEAGKEYEQLRAQCESQRKDLESKMATMKQSLDTANEQQKTLQENMKTVQTDFEKTKAQTSLLEADKQRLGQELAELKQKGGSSEKQLADLQEENRKCNAEINSAKQQVAQMKKLIDKKKTPGIGETDKETMVKETMKNQGINEGKNLVNETREKSGENGGMPPPRYQGLNHGEDQNPTPLPLSGFARKSGQKEKSPENVGLPAPGFFGEDTKKPGGNLEGEEKNEGAIAKPLSPEEIVKNREGAEPNDSLKAGEQSNDEKRGAEPNELNEDKIDPEKMDEKSPENVDHVGIPGRRPNEIKDDHQVAAPAPMAANENAANAPANENAANVPANQKADPANHKAEQESLLARTDAKPVGALRVAMEKDIHETAHEQGADPMQPASFKKILAGAHERHE